jgi:8-oxo-dGTP pyrophosphatase MutT (NUDIX family)
MLNTVTLPTPPVRRPMIDEREIAALASRYGDPVRRSFQLPADGRLTLYGNRLNSDRRAEVVFAIQDADGRIWLQAKPNYPQHTVRLPSGGIHWDEAVEAALHREVAEETGLAVQIKRFVGVIEYSFQYPEHYTECCVPFASHIFHVFCGQHVPSLSSDGETLAWHAVLPSQLLQVAADLRNLLGERRAWGQWRALVHELVYDILA